MNDRTESLEQAIADHDVTLALTPAQVILLALGVWFLLRIIRGIRH